jgi:hypothetical protein
VPEQERELVVDVALAVVQVGGADPTVAQTPQACTSTTASPGPGSGTTIVSTVTGAPLLWATTPFTS